MRCDVRGQSGEYGCFQYLPNTWKLFSLDVLGYVAPQSSTNQWYVAVKKIEQLLSYGYNPREIALIWNGGTPVEKKGINRYGVAYDTAKYADAVLSRID